MARASSGRWLNRFIWFTAAATLLLICSGGMVTSKGVGLAVPDWPTTFGYNMFLFPVSKWVGGILFEHTHRLLASGVGCLTLVLAEWIWISETRGASRWVGAGLMFLVTAILGVRTTPVQIAIGIAAFLTFLAALTQAVRSRETRWLGVAALGAVLTQGVLGGLRVELLKDQIGIFHACLAQAFFGLLVFIGLVRSDLWQRGALQRSTPGMRRLARIALVGTLLIYGQMVLGATMRHEHKDLSILDFPTAYHHWWPDTSAPALEKINAWRDAQALSDVTAFQIWLQMAHRFGAVLAAAAVIRAGFVYQRSRATDATLARLLSFWIIGVFVQITLGAWTIWSNKAADIATAHVAVGAIMFVVGVAISGLAFRFSGNALNATAAKTTASEPVLA